MNAAAATAPAPASGPVFVVRFDTADLRRVLARLRPVLESRAYPLVRLDVRADGSTTVQATDLRTWVKVQGPKVYTHGLVAGRALVPVSALRDIVKAGDECAWLRDYGDGRLALGGGYMEADGLPVACWPSPPGESFTAPECELPGWALHAALRAVLPAVSTDEVRPHMTGVQLAVGAGAWSVGATDGHRLALVDGRAWAPVAHGASLVAVVPAVAAAMVATLYGPVRASRGRAAVRFDAEGESVSAWLAQVRRDTSAEDVTAPRFEYVIPAEGTARAVVRLRAGALEKVLAPIVKADRDKGVVLVLRGSAALDVCTDEDPSGLTIACAAQGKVPLIGVNARYLLDAIAAVTPLRVAHGMGLAADKLPARVEPGAPVDLHLISEVDPITLRDPATGLTALVMPKRI